MLEFQCSSASRKFLNQSGAQVRVRGDDPVSVLFSEPKIPQCARRRGGGSGEGVSVLFSEPKIPQSSLSPNTPVHADGVSVLFSEPKIPQSIWRASTGSRGRSRFSALQRAENSSIQFAGSDAGISRPFQCSSASRKFLNFASSKPRMITPSCFSALQRAENSSMLRGHRVAGQQRQVSVLFSEPKIPQFPGGGGRLADESRFSALQRAENSSITSVTSQHARPVRVSVLFSEPKIPQSSLTSTANPHFCRVSVLFSEPKIPQFLAFVRFPVTLLVVVSVLFSEPKIPQYRVVGVVAAQKQTFQCSSASRKFLNIRR